MGSKVTCFSNLSVLTYSYIFNWSRFSVDIEGSSDGLGGGSIVWFYLSTSVFLVVNELSEALAGASGTAVEYASRELWTSTETLNFSSFYSYLLTYWTNSFSLKSILVVDVSFDPSSVTWSGLRSSYIYTSSSIGAISISALMSFHVCFGCGFDIPKTCSYVAFNCFLGIC